MTMFRLLAVFCILAPGAAMASDPGGHRGDVGLLLYGEDTNRGGVLVEGRYNLAPEDQFAALYVLGALGTGTWLTSTKPSPAFSALPSYGEKRKNFIEVKGTQAIFTDLGLGLSWDRYVGGLGVTISSYDMKVRKLIDDDEYTGGEAKGSGWGGFIYGGFEIPIGRWFVDLILGYRELRGKVKVTMKNDAGASTTADIKPVAGPYISVGLRYRF